MGVGLGLDLFPCSVVSSACVFVVGIPKKCVIRPLGGGTDGFDVLRVVLCCDIFGSLSEFLIHRSTEPSVFNARIWYIVDRTGSRISDDVVVNAIGLLRNYCCAFSEREATIAS